MESPPKRRHHRVREPRRRVVLPARLLHCGSWSDVCILNVSAHGLMIHTGRTIAQGTRIELRRGSCTVIGEVIWRDGGRAGVRAEQQIALEEIVTSVSSAARQPFASTHAYRRIDPATKSGNLAVRALKFAAFTILALCFAGATLPMMRAGYERSRAIAAPLLVRQSSLRHSSL